MKVFFCLTAMFAVCNAGLLGGLGGGSVNEVHVQPQQVHHVQHVHDVQHVHEVQHVAPAPVKIIKIQSSGGGYAGGHGGGSYSYGGGHSGGYAGVSYSQPQIIKVIHEQAPILHGGSGGGGYAVQGYSSGHGHQSYAPHYSSYQSSLESILPQILKIILADSGSSGGSNYNGQLIDAYGHSGTAFITKNNPDYLRSGHVVEKGHLEVVEVKQQNGGGGGGGGGLFGGGKW